MRKRVVVDVDAGTDDAVALLLLIALGPEYNFEVIGITCTHGNSTVDNVCVNVLTLLERINRLDIPVFRGAENSLLLLHNPNRVYELFHGENGFGDKYFPPPKGKIQQENAVPALNRLAKENDGIVLICLGPLTNIALTQRTYPEFSNRVQEVYIMGGNTTAVGNFSSSAEFNFFKDPEAAHIVLSSFTTSVSIVPWETCLKVKIPKEERFQKIGCITNPQISLLNYIETELYTNEKFWTPCDALLAATFINETVIKESTNVYLTVELHGCYTRGQGVIERKKKANVRVIEEIDIEAFVRLVYKMAEFSFENQMI